MANLGGALGMIGGDIYGTEDYKRAKELEDQAMATGMQGQMQTEMNGVQVDPVAKQAQDNALAGLQRKSMTGYDEGDRANVQGALADTANQYAGNMGAIRQLAEGRGQGGSGNELAMQLQGAQAQAQTANKSGTDVAIAGRERALQALAGGGHLATTMRGQGFSEAARRAEAQDEINRRNVAMRVNAQRGGANAAMGRYSNAVGQGSEIGDAAYNTAGDLVTGIPKLKKGG